MFLLMHLLYLNLNLEMGWRKVVNFTLQLHLTLPGSISFVTNQDGVLFNILSDEITS